MYQSIGRDTNDEINSNEEVEPPICEENSHSIDDIQEQENNYYTASFQNIGNSYPT